MKHLPGIIVETIEHDDQRYDTVGDFYYVPASYGDAWDFKISKTKPDYEFLVLIHELVEWYLCQKAGIKNADIDRWDMKFKGEGEPGDDPNAPYHWQHRYATFIERHIASKLDINWEKYCKDLGKLKWRKKK